MAATEKTQLMRNPYLEFVTTVDCLLIHAKRQTEESPCAHLAEFSPLTPDVDKCFERAFECWSKGLVCPGHAREPELGTVSAINAMSYFLARQTDDCPSWVRNNCAALVDAPDLTYFYEMQYQIRSRCERTISERLCPLLDEGFYKMHTAIRWSATEFDRQVSRLFKVTPIGDPNLWISPDSAELLPQSKVNRCKSLLLKCKVAKEAAEDDQTLVPVENKLPEASSVNEDDAFVEKMKENLRRLCELEAFIKEAIPNDNTKIAFLMFVSDKTEDLIRRAEMKNEPFPAFCFGEFVSRLASAKK